MNKKYEIQYLEDGVEKTNQFTEAESIEFYQKMRAGEIDASVFNVARLPQ